MYASLAVVAFPEWPRQAGLVRKAKNLKQQPTGSPPSTTLVVAGD